MHGLQITRLVTTWVSFPESYSKRQKIIRNQKSEIDDLYEKLHLDEKLDLFNIQYNARSIMHNATKLEGEADELGYKLSDKMKTAVWEEFYENANKQSQILKIS